MTDTAEISDAGTRHSLAAIRLPDVGTGRLQSIDGNDGFGGSAT
jgi:hypothetical protein